MDRRKVIKFGKATYSITLPKEWVVEKELEKGDVVRVEQMPSGKLEVSPDESEPEEEVKEIEISADEKESEDIFREVVAAYIKNYTIINITGDFKGKIKEIRSSLQELIGLEIMEVTKNKIVAKSFMDITETKVEETVRRIYYIIKSIGKGFKEILEDGRETEELEELDREVNRNTFFIMKFLFKCLENPGTANEADLENYEIFFSWELVKLLERIADKIKMMADLAIEQEILIKPDSTEKFLEVYEDVMENFTFTMEQYFQKSKEELPDIFNQVEENDDKCNEFLSEYKKAWTPLLIDHLKDVNMFTRNIAEIIIDFE